MYYAVLCYAYHIICFMQVVQAAAAIQVQVVQAVQEQAGSSSH